MLILLPAQSEKIMALTLTALVFVFSFWKVALWDNFNLNNLMMVSKRVVNMLVRRQQCLWFISYHQISRGVCVNCVPNIDKFDQLIAILYCYGNLQICSNLHNKAILSLILIIFFHSLPLCTQHLNIMMLY